MNPAPFSMTMSMMTTLRNARGAVSFGRR